MQPFLGCCQSAPFRESARGIRTHQIGPVNGLVDWGTYAPFVKFREIRVVGQFEFLGGKRDFTT